MPIAFRDLFKVTTAAGLVAFACGDTSAEEKARAGVAGACTLNSDCNQPLVCAFRLCHVECEETRDCPDGQRCVAGDDGKNVCQLPQEKACLATSSCKGDQVCAEDKECRDACARATACVGDQVCSTSGACAEPDEVDEDGNITGKGGSSGMSSGGKAGKGGSSGKGGTAGGAGKASRGGTSGTSDGGMSGEDGNAGAGTSSGASGGSGGSGGSGNVGNAGEGGEPTQQGGTGGTGGSAGGAGKGGAGAGGAGNCVTALQGRYTLRSDHRLLFQDAGEQRPILDVADALPLTNVVSAMDATYHGCAARSDGSAHCWPLTAQGNSYAQLGDGTQSTGALYRGVRVKTGASTYLEGVTSVAQGSSDYYVHNSCAVAGGTVWCWGDTTQLLDNGTQTYSVYARQVTKNGTDPLTGVVAVSLGFQGACALVEAGSVDEVWCWGSNLNGEAGSGAANVRVQYPTKVVGLTNPKSLRLTSYASLVLDGTQVKCWGRNLYGECGTGANTPTVLAPTLVKHQNGDPLDGVVDFGTAANETCAATSDQTLRCWGNTFSRNYADSYPLGATALTGVTRVGSAAAPMFMTSDGQLHLGATTRTPNCGSLE